MADCESRQRDEIESLESIYGDIFTDITPSSTVWNKKASPHFQVALLSQENPDRPVVSLILDVQFTATYPVLPPIVKVIEPKNLLKASQAKIDAKIADVLREYAGEEVCFTIIMDVKELLDDFQQTTEQVLSLEEERAKRLENERKLLEQHEKEVQRKEQLAKQRQTMEANEQILQMRDDYGSSQYEGSPDVMDAAVDVSDHSLVPKLVSGQIFEFANALWGNVPKSNSRFQFKAVQGFIRAHTHDILLDIGTQYIVKPYLPPDLQKKFDDRNIDVSYLLTVINLNNHRWLTSDGKSEIRALELELEQVMALSSLSVLKVFGFQIDQHTQFPSKWTIRLLTELPVVLQSLEDILSTTDFIHWGLARNWLIQLLPALEHMHDNGLCHRLICPLSVLVCETDLEDLTQHHVKTLKLCHPAYGYSLLRMVNSCNTKANGDDFVYKFIPKAWMDPDPSGGYIKTDIWELGVLFMRVMFSYDVLTTEYHTPEEFFSNFDVSAFPGLEEYSERVYDLLTKMLQPKSSKRPSLLELNALKFLRSGIDLSMQGLKSRLAEVSKSLDQSMIQSTVGIQNRMKGDPIGSSKYQTSALDAARRNLAVSQVSRRRYSNNNQSPFFSSDLSAGGNTQESRYEREFEEVGKLGKGGFGEVVKVRNRMEGTFYAIKKIKHRSDKLETLLSEVLSLARLNHQYIVRYYGCWVEELPDTPSKSHSAISSEEEDESSSSDDDEEFESNLNVRSTSFLKSHDSSFQIDYFKDSMDPLLDYDDSDFDDRIVFANSSDEDTGSGEENESDDDDDTEEISESYTDDSSTPKNAVQITRSRSRVQGKSILYIQMEFCENNTLLNLIERGLPANPNEYWRLFRQILEAVSYIHSSGFIHRDLKPTNIFIDKSNNIKVGDFGLAKSSRFSSAVLTNNQVTPKTNKDLSTVVGTFFYTANEVASGEYDEKIDMYSLGIIFFEMCYQLGTGMERAMILNDLRLADIKFPSGFAESRKPTEKRIIRRLLDHDPHKRPGAMELLQSGLIPLEHQDIIIKEALKSLADPASPWQQQVRETLFNQPYSLAQDLMFENVGKNSHSEILDNSMSDFLVLSQTLNELSRIFDNHGAIQDYDGSSLLPKLQAQSKKLVYELLDRSGSVLTLSYDLVLPIARYLSRHKMHDSKIYRHEFVYRPNLRGVGKPDKYYAVAFDIFSNNLPGLIASSAECIKAADEVLSTFPCFKTKNAQTFIIINHSDVLNSVIDFAFGRSQTISQSKRYELMGVLSQLGIERGTEDVKTYLRNDFKIQHTVIKDLVDVFNFTVEPERAMQKLRKIMVDSPLLAKVERALNNIRDILEIVNKLGVKSKVSFCPLSNYNAKYYDGSFMFQAIHRIDKNRKFSRVATGGRYDNLIDSLTNDGLSKSRTPHGVGFQLTTTLLFWLMKNTLKRANTSDGVSKSVTKWKKVRCDVLLTCLEESIIRDSGYELLSQMWARNISCDWYISSFQENILNKAIDEGSNWIVQLRQPNLSRKKLKKGLFKPIRVKNICSNKETDVDYFELLDHLNNEIEERKNENTESIMAESSGNSGENAGELGNDQARIGEPIFNIDINQRVIVVPNAAPRGRKNNKKEKWELENDSKLASSNMMKQLASAPIITVDLTDSVLDMILTSSVQVPLEEWFKKLFFTNNKLPKSYASNIYDTLNKESAKGTPWAILHSPKTDKTTIVDLQR